MKQELINTIKENIPELPEEYSASIVEKFCRIKNPDYGSLDLKPNHELLRINKDKKTASSIKPGNIRLNWRKLLLDSSEITLTAVGVIATPYLIPLAALIIWNKIWSNIKIDLGESHAMTIKLMWENRDKERNWIDENKAHELYNEYLKSINRNKIFIEEFRSILEDLENMKCIEKSGENNWWLREWVKKNTY